MHNNACGTEIDLLFNKGIYPYEYMYLLERFAETSLPSEESFFAKLSSAHISNEDYAHVQKVWETKRASSF